MILNTEHPNLDNFEPLLNEIYDYAFNHALISLNIQDIKAPELFEKMKTDQAFKKEFIKECHLGYGLAQNKIAEETVRLKKLQTETQKSLSTQPKPSLEIRKLKKSLIKTAEYRTLLLRRVLDSLAFLLLGNRVWIAKRFIVTNKINPIDENAIAPNLIIANEMNKEAPLTFTLVSDLSCFVDIGDLIKVDLSNPKTPVEIIEVKSGSVNKFIFDMNTNELFSPEHAACFLVQKHGKDALKHLEKVEKQAERIARQQERMANVTEVLSKSKGIDNSTGMKIILSENEIITDRYEHDIGDIINSAKEKGVGLKTIDDCLHIIATPNPIFDNLHYLYHMKNSSSKCHLTEKNAKSAKEIRAIKELPHSHFFQVMSSGNLRSKVATPIFSLDIRKDLLFDVIFGRVKVIQYLDIKKWMIKFKEKGMNLSNGTNKETQKMLQEHGRYSVPTYKNKVLKVTDISGNDSFILSGIFSKIFYDFEKPTEIIRMMIETVKMRE